MLTIPPLFADVFKTFDDIFVGSSSSKKRTLAIAGAPTMDRLAVLEGQMVEMRFQISSLVEWQSDASGLIRTMSAWMLPCMTDSSGAEALAAGLGKLNLSDVQTQALQRSMDLKNA